MASTRCPGCGAKNPEGSLKCRICGQDLREHVEAPMHVAESGRAQLRSGSLKGVVALALLGVGAIVLGGVLLGVIPGGDVLTDLRNKVPALATESSDGWEAFTEPDASFKATMPVDRVREEAPLPQTATGTADQWLSTLGADDDPDTVLAVSWAALPAATASTTTEATQAEATLTSMSLAWADALGGTVESSRATTFQGRPALLFQVEGLRNAAGDQVTVRALLVLQRDEVYALTSRSIYADHPQFDRLVNGFALL